MSTWLSTGVVLLAGCAATTPAGIPASPSGPPSAADLVSDAQRRLLTMETGHIDVTMRRIDEQSALPWQHWAGDYDLTSRRWQADAKIWRRSGSESSLYAHFFMVGTQDAVHQTRLDLPTRRWQRVAAPQVTEAAGLHSTGDQMHVAAVRAFRPDADAVPQENGDTWTVFGTLPMPLALLALSPPVNTGPDLSALLAATGTARARLTIGRDGAIRTLYVAGLDLDVASGLRKESLEVLGYLTSTITLSAYGKPLPVGPSACSGAARAPRAPTGWLRCNIPEWR